jgi:hypothetical protein
MALLGATMVSVVADIVRYCEQSAATHLAKMVLPRTLTVVPGTGRKAKALPEADRSCGVTQEHVAPDAPVNVNNLEQGNVANAVAPRTVSP